MIDASEKLLENSLALSVRQRARLAHKLILSLDEQDEPDATKLWLEEIERRAQEIEDGTIDLQEWESARESIADAIRHD